LAFHVPANIDIKTADPLFCGGITVFNPIVQNNIKSPNHVAVVGIGGLGHLAIKFSRRGDVRLQLFRLILKKRMK
jgi:alcohol/geraniol dehydrogenase (NADP+)